LADIDLQSTPGICDLRRFGTTLGEILGFDGLNFNEVRVLFFEELVVERIFDYLAGEHSEDDIRIFIKREPHKKSKLVEQRYRLISQISAVDTMIDRMLYAGLADNVRETFAHTGIFIGWTPLSGGYNLVRGWVGDNTEKLSTDFSSWDWTVPEWMTEMFLTIVEQLHPEASPTWLTLHRTRNRALFHSPVFRTTDGCAYKQPFRGAQKSGSYMTLVLNCIGQLILHHLGEIRLGIRIPRPIIMGDDVLRVNFKGSDDFMELMTDLGFKIKFTLSTDSEFAGVVISPDGFNMAYEGKHRFLLAHLDQDDAIETLESYQLLYCHGLSNMFRIVRDLAWTYGPAALISHRQLILARFG
jgi:hypothetical protein